MNEQNKPPKESEGDTIRRALAKHRRLTTDPEARAAFERECERILSEVKLLDQNPINEWKH